MERQEKDFSWGLLIAGFVVGVGTGLFLPKNTGNLLRAIFTMGSQGKLPLKMVLVVRNDLGMGKGKIAAQCAHAAVECYKNSATEDLTKLWSLAGQPKVVLSASSEGQLRNLHEKARTARLTCSLIRDAGRTQLVPGSVTVLGLGPAISSDIDSITGHLKLL